MINLTTNETKFIIKSLHELATYRINEQDGLIGIQEMLDAHIGIIHKLKNTIDQPHNQQEPTK